MGGRQKKSDEQKFRNGKKKTFALTIDRVLIECVFIFGVCAFYSHLNSLLVLLLEILKCLRIASIAMAMYLRMLQLR